MNINPFDIFKNAQKIQEQMGAFQEKLGGVIATGAAGGGMVQVDLNGRIELIAVRIAPEVMEGGDTEMLQDLIVAAFSSASENVKEALNREMGSMAGGLDLGGLLGASGSSGGGDPAV